MSAADDPEYQRWRTERSYELRHKKPLKHNPRKKYNLGTTPRYTRTRRIYKGGTVKYKIEERFGDKEQRKEKNLRNPFITLMPESEAKHTLLPSGMTRAQGWATLRNSWRWFRIYKSQGDEAKM